MSIQNSADLMELKTYTRVLDYYYDDMENKKKHKNFKLGNGFSCFSGKKWTEC